MRRTNLLSLEGRHASLLEKPDASSQEPQLFPPPPSLLKFPRPPLFLHSSQCPTSIHPLLSTSNMTPFESHLWSPSHTHHCVTLIPHLHERLSLRTIIAGGRAPTALRGRRWGRCTMASWDISRANRYQILLFPLELSHRLCGTTDRRCRVTTLMFEGIRTTALPALRL